MASFNGLNVALDAVAVIVFIMFAGLTNGYKFDVGGEEGWVVNHSSDDDYYNHWAQKLRFQVHDTLFFKYKKGEDSVLMVTKGDYDNCNIDNPIYKMDGGDSYFTFDRYGPFYFISGSQDCNCLKGQKLIAVVLAPRPPPPPPTVPGGSNSSSSPPPPSPLSVSPSPAPKDSENDDSNNSTANNSRATMDHVCSYALMLISLLLGFSASSSWIPVYY